MIKCITGSDDNMGKIEIHDLEEILKQNYPPKVVESLISQVLILSMQVKNEYPDYRSWFLTTQVPGIYDGTRNIIIAHIRDRIVGFISLKKTAEEKKICTFYVEKNLRRNKIGTVLVEKAIEYLETEKPLITIPLSKLNEFTKIGEKYNWEISDIKENLYRLSDPEVIVNGAIETKEKIIIPSKSMKKTWKIYKISNQQKLWKYILNNIRKQTKKCNKVL
ncbi:MAG: GNAT family N-acetyltransferase [bacterium]|nr:GNAT family N-acetyltransferase [bacterium]